MTLLGTKKKVGGSKGSIGSRRTGGERYVMYNGKKLYLPPHVKIQTEKKKAGSSYRPR